MRCQRQHPLVPCSIWRIPGDQPMLRVRPRRPLRAVAEGQTCVFYRGEQCLGGSEVVRVLNTLNSRISEQERDDVVEVQVLKAIRP